MAANAPAEIGGATLAPYARYRQDSSDCPLECQGRRQRSATRGSLAAFLMAAGGAESGYVYRVRHENRHGFPTQLLHSRKRHFYCVQYQCLTMAISPLAGGGGQGQGAGAGGCRPLCHGRRPGPAPPNARPNRHAAPTLPATGGEKSRPRCPGAQLYFGGSGLSSSFRPGRRVVGVGFFSSSSGGDEYFASGLSAPPPPLVCLEEDFDPFSSSS